MDNLPNEMVLHIAQYLKLRSLLRLSATCTRYHAVLKDVIQSRKEKLFAPATLETEDGVLMFFPGPAIRKQLLPGMPIDGVYFIEQHSVTKPVQFFFQRFRKYLKYGHTDFVATIKTKVKKYISMNLEWYTKPQIIVIVTMIIMVITANFLHLVKRLQNNSGLSTMPNKKKK